MNSFEHADIRLEQICLSEEISDFDCGDDDLNEYFFKDSAAYRKELLSQSYQVFRVGSDLRYPLAYIDFCNDAIRREYLGGAKRKIHHLKRGFRNYPAVKITRIGVRKSFQGMGLGSLILDAVKLFFLQNMKAGCRFLTLDAYPSRVGFYRKNRFRELLVKDESVESHGVPMFFDLKELLECAQ